MFAFEVVKAQRKYRTVSEYSCATSIKGYSIHASSVALDEDGWLTILSGYTWDGPSGPTIDTPDFMRASLAHDVLYSLMMKDLLPIECRSQVDCLFHLHLIQDKMPRFRAWYAWTAVRLFGWIPITWARTKRKYRELKS